MRCQPRGRTTQRRRPLAEPVRLALRGFERERAAHGVDQGGLTGDDVGPGRRQRVLEIGHEDAGARVERVDHHLGLGGTGDLHPTVVEVGRRGRDGPVALADLARSGEEVRQDAGIQLGLALLAAAQQVQPDRPEPALQVGDERERVIGQDALGARDCGASDSDARRRHQPSPRRTVASMSPCGSVVDT